MAVDDILLEAEEKMEKSLETLRESLRSVRTGRATPGLVDHIRVEYYGSSTPLKQLANVAAPDARSLVIKPFDPTSIGDIEKAILKSDIGMAPSSDGKLLRITVPPLSEERRKQLGNRVRDAGEEAKIAIRQIRRDANRTADKEQKDKLITEDDAFACKDEVQELTKKYEADVDHVLHVKTEEIMEV